jgi:anti-sigma regulatory factor (Ser/Thr protein kinase)
MPYLCHSKRKNMTSIKAIKRRFTIIIVGLSLLFIINLLYLTGLYHAIADETNKLVLLCIEEADNEELQIRLGEISRLSDDERTISINKSIKDVDLDTSDEEIGESLSPVTDVIEFSLFIKEIRLIVHQNIDTILPINLQILDSLIEANFKKKGLSAELFYTEIVDLNTNNILASSRPATMRKKTNSHVFEYDTENGLAYKIYTSSLTGSVLRRMSGILVSTFLIIVLFGYAFWYFIRTVVRQKTLEEMKTDFTNNMTHELNTPISVAYSAIDTLLNFRQGESKEKREQYLNIGIEQLSRLRDLVEHILSGSMDKNRNIAINKEDIELKPLFEQIIDRQKLKTEKSVDTNIFVQPEKMTVYADRTHLYNIINNLIDNAIKYSFDTVKIQIQSCMDDNRCIISIKDNGIGISKENRKRIFDRFYRVPQGNLHNVKGYGLGLFYVKTMVERQNFEINVKSAPGKGTEFIIKIPVK